MRYYGAHVSAAGGLKNSIKRGNKYNLNAIQTMFSAPMRWSLKDIAQEQIEAMAQEQANSESTVKKVLFHGVYLTNLARKEKQKFHLSKVSQQTHLDAAERLQKAFDATKNGGDVLGVTFHPGSALDLEPADGIKRISQGLNWILEQVPGTQQLLLETAAGAGNVMGDTFESLAAMRDGVEDKDRVGYVVDTQHTFVSGYDWVNDLENVIKQMDKVLGLDLVRAIHLNDSLQPFNSHKDRHASLGEGEFGKKAIKAVLNHPKLKNIPFILETPALKEDSTMTLEIQKLNDWIED